MKRKKCEEEKEDKSSKVEWKGMMERGGGERVGREAPPDQD